MGRRRKAKHGGQAGSNFAYFLTVGKFLEFGNFPEFGKFLEFGNFLELSLGNSLRVL